MAVLSKKMPVWLVSIIAAVLIGGFIIIAIFSTPAGRTLARVLSKFWTSQYELTSNKAEHRLKALRAIPYNAKLTDEKILQLARMAKDDPDIRVRHQAIGRITRIANQKTLPDAVMRVLVAKLKQQPELKGAPNYDLRYILNAFGRIVNDKNVLDAGIILYICRIPSDGLRQHSNNVAIQTLGNIGVKQVMPDECVSRLTNLMVLHPKQQNIPWTLHQIATKRSLPPETVKELIEISQKSGNPYVRKNAIMALASHCRHHPCDQDLFRQALNDPWLSVRHAAARALLQLYLAGKEELPALMQFIQDQTQPPAGQQQAFHRLTQKYSRHSETIPFLLNLANHPKAEIRILAVTRFPNIDIKNHQQDPAWLARINKALTDTDPKVREIAVGILMRMRFNVATKNKLLLPLLDDNDPKVRIRAIYQIGRDQHQDKKILTALTKASNDYNDQVARQARSKLLSINNRSGSAAEKMRRVVKSKKRVAALLFWAFIIMAGVTAVGFLVYYLIRCIIYLNQRNWKALLALGIMLLWTGITVLLAYGFVIAALGMGHSAKNYYTVLAIIFAVLLIYSAIGWGLRYPIRR